MNQLIRPETINFNTFLLTGFMNFYPIFKEFLKETSCLWN